MTNFYFIFCCSAIALCTAAIPRPRGVAISMASAYKPGDHFNCLDGSKQIPFEYVNDDYCDCPDASDEPGTSACPNGKFHCTNAGYKPTNILSTRVNDGICDCCDGTDEWGGNIDCVNNCKELGKKMREEMDQTRRLQEEGFKAKLSAIESGKQVREEKKLKLEQLAQTKVELETVKQQMEEKKNTAEEPEKAAKEKHEHAWKEELERKKALAEHERALVAFNDLDANDDDKLHFTELQTQTGFDIDSNGEVSDEEAREHLEGEEHVEFDQFIEKVWPNVKQFYKPINQQPEPVVPDTKFEEKPKPRVWGRDGRKKIFNHRKHGASDADDDDDDDDEMDEEDEYDSMKAAQEAVPKVVMPDQPVKLVVPEEEDEEAERDLNRTGETEEKVEEEEKMPDYDEETKKLIEIADEARKQFTEAEAKLKETDNEINSLNSYLNADYGPEEEYSSLRGNCFEYTDREYTYKLCGYERASQRPKNGGSETTLGNWGKWVGPPEDKYAAQKYENGLSCWNGPNRSVKVNMKCGIENKLVNAFEPSRCEYEFDFITPSRCSEPPARSSTDTHDEL